jgi:GAF domain-containing protein
LGKGVCGTSAKENRSILVSDVHQFVGHISCDSDSNSEIVIPIRVGGKVVGVFDIDSPTIKGLTESEVDCFEKIVESLIQETDWSPLLK